MKNLVPIISAALLVGCAAPRYASFEMEKIRATDPNQLCALYHDWRVNDQLEPEAKRQLEAGMLANGLPEKDLELAREGSIQVGMTLAGLYAAWGFPKRANRSVGRFGVHIQHVYEWGYYPDNHRTAYVYTENGILTSWQDQK